MATVSTAYHALAVARGVTGVLDGPLQPAVVQSAFARAVNLLLPPDRLLALTAPDAAWVPNGVIVALPPGRADGPTLLGLRPGQSVWLGRRAISVPTARLVIGTERARVWDPRPRFPSEPLAPAPPRDGLDRLGRILAARCLERSDGFAPLVPLAPALERATSVPPSERLADASPLIRRAAPAVHALLQALAGRRWRELGVAARRLVGLGPGLTPSGDDFLIGVCGALALVGALAPSVAEDCRAAARVIAASAAGRTTLLSLTWLRQAAAGEFSAEFGGLLAALATAGDDAALERAAARLLAIGGTSGWDMAVGVLLGGQAMARLIPERGASARRGAYRPPAP